MKPDDLALAVGALLPFLGVYALGVEFQWVAHGGDAAHGRLAVECRVWPMPVVVVQEGLQGCLALS